MTASTSAARPARGGGRIVTVAPERLVRWIDGFAGRHGGYTATGAEAGLLLTAADGATATLTTPFGRPAVPTVDGLVEHALRERRLGLLLVRLGGHAVGIAEGRQLSTAKVGRRQVHGRSAAGGWSQQRFARRRENQVSAAHEAATALAAALLVPAADGLAAVVTGGDRAALTAVFDDRRLARLVPLRDPRILDVPDPRRDVLEQAVDRARSVTVHVVDPPATLTVLT